MRIITAESDISSLQGLAEDRPLDIKSTPIHTTKLVQFMQSFLNIYYRIYRAVCFKKEIYFYLRHN